MKKKTRRKRRRRGPNIQEVLNIQNQLDYNFLMVIQLQTGLMSGSQSESVVSEGRGMRDTDLKTKQFSIM